MPEQAALFPELVQEPTHRSRVAGTSRGAYAELVRSGKKDSRWRWALWVLFAYTSGAGGIRALSTREIADVLGERESDMCSPVRELYKDGWIYVEMPDKLNARTGQRAKAYRLCGNAQAELVGAWQRGELFAWLQIDDERAAQIRADVLRRKHWRTTRTGV